MLDLKDSKCMLSEHNLSQYQIIPILVMIKKKNLQHISINFFPLWETDKQTERLKDMNYTKFDHSKSNQDKEQLRAKKKVGKAASSQIRET